MSKFLAVAAAFGSSSMSGIGSSSMSGIGSSSMSGIGCASDIRPGKFPGIHFQPNDGSPGGVANDMHEAITLLKRMQEDTSKDSQEFKNNYEALNNRLCDLEVKLNRPGVTQETKSVESPESAAFFNWMRKDQRGLNANEIKLLSTDSDQDGGYFVPVNTVNKIIEKLILFSPVRELANVMTISTGDTMELPAEGSTEAAGGWVSERGSRAETTSPRLAPISIVAYEMYANPFLTQKLLDDSGFNVEAWIQNKLTRRFAVLEGTAFLTGSGVGQPNGILNNSDITVVNSGSAAAITAAGLSRTYHTLPEEFARNATWLMKRATIGAIRLLTDSYGQYLWQPGLSAGMPSLLFGQPYREAVDMPAEGAGLKSVLFGDFQEGYTVLDRQGMKMVRDIYTNKPKVEFYTTKRVGGGVTRADAFVINKCST